MWELNQSIDKILENKAREGKNTRRFLVQYMSTCQSLKTKLYRCYREALQRNTPIVCTFWAFVTQIQNKILEETKIQWTRLSKTTTLYKRNHSDKCAYRHKSTTDSIKPKTATQLSWWADSRCSKFSLRGIHKLLLLLLVPYFPRSALWYRLSAYQENAQPPSTAPKWRALNGKFLKQKLWFFTGK